MKYLLQAIDARRECVRLSDHELRDLLIEVRSGKDDRIEFTESMVRLLDELKSSEHATAFLTKVAKRDAPDYYDVIKNPMDLGTMMRNVRQARYKSKSQFVRDLDLIWDNCLTYNSEPTHPLRRSVQMLRAKANHLLTYVNDTNDVKEALNQWQASIGLQRRRSESLDGSRKDGAGVASEQVAGSAAGRDRLGSGAFGLSRIGGGVTSGAAADMVDTPFEQRPALLRNADGMSTFQRLDASLTALDEEFMRRYMGTDAGPSSRPFDSSAEQGLSAAASLDMLKTLEGPQGGMLRRALTTPSQLSTNGVTANGSAPHDGDGSPSLDPAAAAAADDDEETRMPYDAGAAWWNGMVHPSLLAAGVMPLAPSEATANKRIQTIHGRLGKRRRKQIHALGGKMEGQDGRAQQQPFGGVDALERNVRTIVRLRQTHAKFGRLSSHIESGEPIPADLGVVSSDDESGAESADEAAATQTHSQPKVRRKAPDALALPFHDLAGNPFAKLGGERASDMLQSNTNVLLAHAGFDGSQKAAADVLADVAGEFLMNLGRTLRNYTDRFAHEMSVEDLVLHTLYENGGLDVRRLESYVADDVLRYGNKMSDLLRKLRASYRDTLANADLPMADEAAYFGAEAHAERTAGQGSVQAGGTDGDGGDEHILRGGYARELADEDFFGFKDMGLDAELGIDVGRQLASMPSRMFSRKDGAAGPGGAANGVGAKARLGGGSAESGRSMLEFEPPPPFVPLSEAAIAAQIAILRPFYRELMRTRGQWQRIGGDDGDGAAAAVPTNSFGADGDADRTDADEPKNAFVILPDEEQERQRYKVPPTGKMPRRAMKQRQAPQQSSGAAGGGGNASSNGKSNNAQAAARKLTAPPSTSQAKSNGTSIKSKSKGGVGGGGGGKKKDTSTGGTKQATTNHAVTVG